MRSNFAKIKPGTKDIYDGHMVDDYDEIFLVACYSDCGCVLMTAKERISVNKEDIIWPEEND